MRVASTVFAGLLATTVAAQTFPSKPVRIVAPFPPASVADVLARPIAQRMNEAWGLIAASNTPEQFSSYVQEEIVRWAKVVKASGARAD